MTTSNNTTDNTMATLITLLREERTRYNRTVLVSVPSYERTVAQARRAVLDRVLMAAGAGVSPMQLMEMVFNLATSYEARMKEVGRDPSKDGIQRFCAVRELDERAEYATELFDLIEA